MTTYPLRLKGLVLSYVEGSDPRYRVFKSRKALELFVGKKRIEHGRSDEHWIDSIIEGSVLVVDDGIKIEYDEGAK